MINKQTVNKIFNTLEQTYPEAGTELKYSSTFELLISVMLSAQCTDKRVNQVTQKLFIRANTPQQMIKLDFEELKSIIYSCGLSNTKAKNILATCNSIIDNFNGDIPDTIDELQTLPGVGRKTANVVASVAFNVPAIAVDTHVFRVSNRIGLVQAANVEKAEQQLMQSIPKKRWLKAHHLLIWHGRRTCVARNPKCGECSISMYCKQCFD